MWRCICVLVCTVKVFVLGLAVGVIGMPRSVVAENAPGQTQEATAVPELAEAVLERVETQAIIGEPLGVGRIQLNYLAGHGPIIFPDQPLKLEVAEQRVFYTAFDIQYQADQGASPYQVRQIEALFLLGGEKPFDVSLRGPDGNLLDESLQPMPSQAGSLRDVRRRWWQVFAASGEDLDGPRRQLHNLLLTSLARRHGLPLPQHMTSNAAVKEKPLHGLEGQFERAVGMLLGIESVKLAMQDDVTLRQATHSEQANQSLPRPPRLQSLRVPEYTPTSIERIAMRVPAECFYLRAGNLSNYFYFRDFLLGWGGNLDDIVSPQVMDHQIRQKLERQLGLDTAQMDVGQWDPLVSDLALIGHDPLFVDGAAVGVLLEAQQNDALTAEIHKQRLRIRQQHPDADEVPITINGRSVSLLSTPDNRVRSFYVVDGRYHLVTNSEHLLERFLETARGDRVLGKLDEFGYARSKTAEKRSMVVFLYLSDPFFQNLISPRYRIEMTRRAEAKRDLQRLQIARLLARAEGVPAKSVSDLVAAKLLPSHFGQRPDGARASYRDGAYVDTLRGHPGTFLPVLDVPIQKVTATELNGYKRFLAEYNQEWRRVDPVTVAFSKLDDPGQDGLERVGVDIVVAPYARQRYALLNKYLAAGSQWQLSPVAGDLISVQAAVRNGSYGPTYLLSIGLQDDVVEFKLEHGAVRRVGGNPDDTFAKTRSFAALTPPSTDMLRTLASVLIEGREPQPTRRRPIARPTPMPPSTPKPLQMLYYMTWAVTNISPDVSNAAKYLSMIKTQDDVMVISEAGKIRQHVHASINKRKVEQPHGVQLTVGSLDGAKVEPYIQAYTYVEARRHSTNTATMLERWTEWLQLTPAQTRGCVEDLLAARLTCPLGGEFTPVPDGSGTRWSSTAWTTASRFEVDEIPPQWKFPFLHWLQGLAVDFDLGRNVLVADMELTARPRSTARRLPNPLKTLPAGPPAATTVAVNRLPVSPLPANPAEQPRWVLGVRLAQQVPPLTVTAVYPNSPAARAGIRTGDVIQKFNDRVPGSSDDLLTWARLAQNDEVVWVELERRDLNIRLRVSLAND